MLLQEVSWILIFFVLVDDFKSEVNRERQEKWEWGLILSFQKYPQ